MKISEELKNKIKEIVDSNVYGIAADDPEQLDLVTMHLSREIIEALEEVKDEILS